MFCVQALTERWSKLLQAEVMFMLSLDQARGRNDAARDLSTLLKESSHEFGDWAIASYKQIEELTLPLTLPEIFVCRTPVLPLFYSTFRVCGETHTARF
mgnify:CR=1 FL=1